MTDKAKQFRDGTKKTVARLRKSEEKARATLIRDVTREIALIKKRVLSEAKEAAGKGRRQVVVDAVRIGASNLSSNAIAVLSRDFKKDGFEVEIKMDEVSSPIPGEMPGRHDIEGWEEYAAKQAASRKQFISEITLSW